MTTPPKIHLDGFDYYTEKGSYQHDTKKTLSKTISLGTKYLRSEGGMTPDTWSFNVVCLSRTELSTLSGSFIKTTDDTRLAFSGIKSDPHMVYFDEMGNISALNRSHTLFRVPVKLSASEVGQ